MFDNVFFNRETTSREKVIRQHLKEKKRDFRNKILKTKKKKEYFKTFIRVKTMYASLEINGQDLATKGDDSLIKIDANIQSLSWTSKSSFTQVTASRCNEEEARFQKFLYYQEGWLAVGNANSMVGCTYTTTLSEQQRELIKQREEKLNKNKLNQELSINEVTSSSINTQAQINNDTPPSAINPSSSSSTSTHNNLPNTNTQTATTQTSSNANINLNRTNFNLRGHKSDIKLVRWNEVNILVKQI